MRRLVDIWYVCDEILCNFDCAYCTTQAVRRRGGNRIWGSDEGEQRYHAVVRWLAGLPWSLKVRLQTLGEPFMAQAFLEGAAWLSNQPNIAIVELVTNGSFTERTLAMFAARANMARTSFWITYHHGQIAPETLVARAARAQASGAFVVVHALLFPDTIEPVRHLAALCGRAGVRTDVTLGHNLNQAYPGQGLAPLIETDVQALIDGYRDPRALEAMVIAHRGPRGHRCSAGHDYLRIFSDGAVYPCAPYREMAEQRLGSALDPGFVPPLRVEPYAPCLASGMCACKEDYFHLERVRAALRFPRSLGYYEAEAPVIPAI